MADSDLTVEIKNLNVTQTNLKLVSRRLRDMSYIMDVIGQYMTTETQENFLKEQEPSGKKWEKSKAATKRGGRTLTDQGHLFKSITHKAEKYSVTFGANITSFGSVVYAAIHQFGGRTGKNYKTVIKARPYVGLTEQHEKEIAIRINRWLLR